MNLIFIKRYVCLETKTGTTKMAADVYIQKICGRELHVEETIVMRDEGNDNEKNHNNNNDENNKNNK